MNSSELREKLKEDMDFLKEKYQVKRLGIFGSYTRGEEKVDSDVDILVEFDRSGNQSIGLFKFMELQDFLSNKIQKKVDLIEKEGVKKSLKENILKSTVYV